MDFVPDRDYDLAIFDSAMKLRIQEFQRFKAWLRPGAVVVFHDTAPHHAIVTDGVSSLIREGALIGVELPTPRGVFIGRLVPNTNPVASQPSGES